MLIPNTTTFEELMRILATKKEVEETAKAEAEIRQEEEFEEKLKEIMGDQYEPILEAEQESDQQPDDGKPHRKQRPGPIQLRESVEMIAEVAIAGRGICQVFVNGYAIYDNGERRTVLWLDVCTHYTCYFNKLTEKEKQYQVEKSPIKKQALDQMLWYEVLMIKGEDRITSNLKFPTSDNTRSDAEVIDPDEKREPNWYGSIHIDGPEEAYLKKEERKEKLALLDEDLRKTYLLREAGYNQTEIGDTLGVSQQSISKRMKVIREVFELYEESIDALE